MTLLVYLDSSAIAKLVRYEAESRALIRFLRDRPERVSSVVSEIEVSRAARRAGLSGAVLRRGGRVLARIGLIELDAPIRARASSVDPVSLRALDAIHIATALDIGADIESFVTYDERQAAAARNVGLGVLEPRD